MTIVETNELLREKIRRWSLQESKSHFPLRLGRSQTLMLVELVPTFKASKSTLVWSLLHDWHFSSEDLRQRGKSMPSQIAGLWLELLSSLGSSLAALSRAFHDSEGNVLVWIGCCWSVDCLLCQLLRYLSLIPYVRQSRWAVRRLRAGGLVFVFFFLYRYVLDQ